MEHETKGEITDETQAPDRIGQTIVLTWCKRNGAPADDPPRTMAFVLEEESTYSGNLYLRHHYPSGGSCLRVFDPLTGWPVIYNWREADWRLPRPWRHEHTIGVRGHRVRRELRAVRHWAQYTTDYAEDCYGKAVRRLLERLRACSPEELDILQTSLPTNERANLRPFLRALEKHEVTGRTR